VHLVAGADEEESSEHRAGRLSAYSSSASDLLEWERT
jgi:hypothetical protein